MKLTERCKELVREDNWSYVFEGNLSSDEDIVIDLYPYLIVKGNIETKKSIIASCDLIVYGNVTAGGDILVEKYLEADGNITAGWDIKVGHELVAGGHVNAGGDIFADDGVYAEENLK